jgi:hypothetical protein
MRIVATLPAVMIVLLMLSSGCAPTRARWVCGGSPCVPREQATAQCQAKTNAYFISSNDQGFIDQCMRGAGFQRVACGDADQQHAECR